MIVVAIAPMRCGGKPSSSASAVTLTSSRPANTQVPIARKPTISASTTRPVRKASNGSALARRRLEQAEQVREKLQREQHDAEQDEALGDPQGTSAMLWLTAPRLQLRAKLRQK